MAAGLFPLVSASSPAVNVVAVIDPNWVSAIAAIAAFGLSIAALLITVRTRRSEIDHSLVQQRNEINVAFAEYEVRSPFAHLLSIPAQDIKDFTPKICLLFLQINLLHDVYQHRRWREKEALKAYETWARSILLPWIQSDPHLTAAIRKIYATDDLMPKAFVKWMQERMPV